jgi:hypothetical protein
MIDGGFQDIEEFLANVVSIQDNEKLLPISSNNISCDGKDRSGSISII